MARRAKAVALAFCLGLSGGTQAGSFAISPVRLSLAGAYAPAALTVRNTGTQPSVIQVEVLAWSQRDGAEVLQPTRGLLATPPIFTVPVDGVQVVRVGSRGSVTDGSREIAYRLLLKEIPPAIPAGTQGLQMALHISLPVFIAPTVSRSSVRWDARRVDGKLMLGAVNEGNVHVQVVGLSLDGATPLPGFNSGYVLPGERREWPIAHEARPGSALRLVAQTDAGPVDANLVVSPP